MRVLGRKTSINVRKILWLADELGLNYEHEVWGMPDKDPNVPEFLALNPNGMVPVLEDEGLILWESHAISRYLSDKFDQKFVPQDHKAFALMNQWLDWQSGDLSPKSLYAVLALVRKVPGFDDPEKIAESLKAWTQKMLILEDELSDGRAHIAGDQFSLADISLTLSIFRWTMVDGETAKTPNCLAYLKKHAQRPAAAPYLSAATP